MDITRENLLTLLNDGRELQKLSIAGLERLSGVPKDTVRDFLRGKTQILRADKLQKILRVLQPADRLAVDVMLTETTEIVPRPETSEKEYVEIPTGMSAGDVVALRVETDAMAPVFHQGWVIYYATKPLSDSVTKTGWQVPYRAMQTDDKFGAYMGKPCVIRLADGRLMLRTLKTGPNGQYTLTAYNSPDIREASVKDVYKIVFIKTN